MTNHLAVKKKDDAQSNMEKDCELLLWLVRLFHSDPQLALSVSKAYGLNQIFSVK